VNNVRFEMPSRRGFLRGSASVGAAGLLSGAQALASQEKQTGENERMFPFDDMRAELPNDCCWPTRKSFIACARSRISHPRL
jgi:hypothetical protein